MNEEQLALHLSQMREVQELRRRQLERNGGIWDSLLCRWVTYEPSKFPADEPTTGLIAVRIA